MLCTALKTSTSSETSQISLNSQNMHISPGRLQTTQISPMSQLLDATTLLASQLTTATLRLQVLHHHVKNTKSILYNKQYGFGQF